MLTAPQSISACNRCRKRKVRCDPGIPTCSLCRSSGSVCEYTDSSTKITYPRTYISDLENQVSRLEINLQQLSEQHHHGASGSNPSARSTTAIEPDTPEEGAYPDMIRLESGGDGHFLGASSGLHLARSVLQSARRNSTTFDLHDISVQPGGNSSESHGQTTIEQTFDGNEIQLPPWETTEGLINMFFKQFGVQYPILVMEELLKDVRDFLQNGDIEGDPWTSFILRMVLSISLHLLSHDDSDAAMLSEGFRRSAIAQLSNVVRSKNHRTLQCLLLLMLSSILSSESAPMWYISGICMRMCVDLGYHSERMMKYVGISPASTEDIDTKRRLFWVAYTFDRSLAKMLGRPFFIDDDQIDVQFPCSSLPEPVRLPVSHWLRMQRLQSELVRHLHFSRNSSGLQAANHSDLASWRTGMSEKLETWRDEAKELANSDDGHDGPSMDWWEYWYHNARLMLHQPVSHSEKESIMAAYEAAKNMTHLTFIRAHEGTSGFTWLDLHCQLVSCLTLLFLVLRSSDAKSKAKDEWLSFKTCIVEWQVILDKLAIQWDSMVKTKEVLSHLANETMCNIEDDNLRNRPKDRLRRTGQKRQYSHLIMQELDSPGSGPRDHAVRNSRSLQLEVGNRENTAARKRNQSAGVGGSPGATESHCSSKFVACLGQSQRDLNQLEQTASFADEHRYGQYQQQFESVAPFDYLDFVPILGGNLWAGLDQFETPLQLPCGPYGQATDFNGLDTESFGLPWMDSSLERRDETLTDSVLNFHGSFNEGDVNI